MSICSFLCHCFSTDGAGKKTSTLVTRDFEEKGRGNLVAVSSAKPTGNDEMVSADSKDSSRGNKSVSVDVVSELPSGQSLLNDSELQNHQSNISDCEIFKYSELEKATNEFDPSRILGSGGYGTVYSGTLNDGRLVAIKRLHEDKFKILKLHDKKLDEKTVRTFINEVSMLTRMRHENLVQLYGCTSPQTRELLLVQEYVPNGTVARRLQKGSFPWSTRLNVALQTSSALAYLHASNIVHRDVKTSNILLDRSLNAKVADFGLSRIVPYGATHITTDPAGSRGYIDPEYYEQGLLSDKSDVYSFGVVLAELISSLPASHEDESQAFLSDFAMDHICKGQLGNLVDPNLGFQSDNWVSETVSAVAELAFVCLQRERRMRPSMSEVLNTLESIKSGSSQTARKWGSNECNNAAKGDILESLPDDYFENK